MIKPFTITGADDDTSTVILTGLAKQFPFVEWGILISRSARRTGKSRFPSDEWLKRLQEAQQWHNMMLSAHLCGEYVTEFLKGNFNFLIEFPPGVWDMFGRVQINTHGLRHQWDIKAVDDFIWKHPNKEFIFQYDGANTYQIEHLMQHGRENISTLFDMSHGAGVLPGEWPEHIDGLKCGYAGGLSPENLENELIKISRAAGEENPWIDIETHVRSNEMLDPIKVMKCLQILKDFHQ